MQLLNELDKIPKLPMMTRFKPRSRCLRRSDFSILISKYMICLNILPLVGFKLQTSCVGCGQLNHKPFPEFQRVTITLLLQASQPRWLIGVPTKIRTILTLEMALKSPRENAQSLNNFNHYGSTFRKAYD